MDALSADGGITKEMARAIANLGGESGQGGLSLRSDNLDAVGELYTEDAFRQLIVAIEATPVFRRLRRA
jgi:hypothetical protein